MSKSGCLTGAEASALSEGSDESPATAAAVVQSPAKPSSTAKASPHKPAAADKPAEAATASSDKTAATGKQVAAAPAAAKPAAIEDEEEDLEISDEELLEGADSDVDEDWGGDWA